MLTLRSSRAGALVGIDEVYAGASILTWLRCALVYLLAAVYPMVSRNTLSERERARREIRMNTSANLAIAPVRKQQ